MRENRVRTQEKGDHVAGGEANSEQRASWPSLIVLRIFIYAECKSEQPQRIQKSFKHFEKVPKYLCEDIWGGRSLLLFLKSGGKDEIQ